MTQANSQQEGMEVCSGFFSFDLKRRTSDLWRRNMDGNHSYNGSASICSSRRIYKPPFTAMSSSHCQQLSYGPVCLSALSRYTVFPHHSFVLLQCNCVTFTWGLAQTPYPHHAFDVEGQVERHLRLQNNVRFRFTSPFTVSPI